jgi:hypothetical protein
MSKYFYLSRFIEILKIKYHKITKLIICFDPRKSLNKTKYNQLQLHLYGLIIEVETKKSAIGYNTLIEICDVDNIINDDSLYEIIITLSDGKNKTLNINKPFQLLEVITDLKTFTTKDKKIIEYYPNNIINNINNTIFNDMITKKKII